MNTSAAGTEPFWRLLELISVADPGDDAFAEAEALLATGVDPDLLLSFAARHRMVALLADFVRRAGAIYDFPSGVGHLLNNTLDWNRYRVGLLTEEAVAITDAVTRRGLDVVFNKGVVLQSTLYDERGVRFFADVDLMIAPEQRGEFAAVLRDLGYSEAMMYDEKTQRLVDVRREHKLMYQLYPDHLPHFHKLTPGTGVPYSRVDVAFNLTWYGSAWHVPMTEVLSDKHVVRLADGRMLPALDHVHGFLFLVLHLFRECWFQRTAEFGGLRLTQFSDIQKFWQRFGHDAQAGLVETIQKYDLGPVVAWICHHVDALFGSGIVTALKLEEFCVPEWLCSAGAKDSTSLQWDGDMRARLRSTAPVIFQQSAEPPFAAQARVVRTED